jgi:hypothetical protein
MLYVDVMTNGTKGVQSRSVTLNEHQHNAPSHSIMVSYNSPTMFLYLPSGHNALDSQWTSLHYIEPPYLLNYNYIVVPLPSGFCECVSSCWRCARMPHKVNLIKMTYLTNYQIENQIKLKKNLIILVKMANGS